MPLVFRPWRWSATTGRRRDYNPLAVQGTLRLIVVLLVASAAMLAIAPSAIAQGTDPVPTPPEPEPQPSDAELTLDVKGVKAGKVRVNKRVTAVATVRPFVPGQELQIGIYRKGKPVKRERKTIERKQGSDTGVATLRSPRLIKPGRYSARAVHDETADQKRAERSSGSFAIKYPRVGGRDGGKVVKLFNNLLEKQGYGNAAPGKSFNGSTSRAVLAFRKVNGMARNTKATPDIFRRLADGKGAFKLKYPGQGRHVEVDVSRQVMVLADKGKPRYTYAVSTGAPGTPSDRGHYRFFRREPGFNNLGMYYSVYYNRGEAIHGYKSVPNYPASRGCIRNAIADAQFAYNWVRIGMSIYVYD